MKQSNHRPPAGKWLVPLVGAALAIAAMTSQGAQAASMSPSYAGSVFGGFTSQRLPSFFQLSKNEKMLVVGSVALRMSCTSGSGYMTEDDYSREPIAASGNVHDGWALPPTKLSDGTLYGGSSSFTGHLDRRRQKLTGTWHMHETYVTATGQTIECDSGVVRFTALQ